MKKLITFTLVSFMFVSTVISDEITDTSNPKVSKPLNIDDLMLFQKILNTLQNSTNRNVTLEIRSNDVCLKDHKLNEESCLPIAMIVNLLRAEYRRNKHTFIDVIEEVLEKIEKQDFPNGKILITTENNDSVDPKLNFTTNNSCSARLEFGDNSLEVTKKEKNNNFTFDVAAYWNGIFSFKSKVDFDNENKRVENFTFKSFDSKDKKNQE